MTCYTLGLTSSSAMAERPREAILFSINVQRYSQNHAQNWIFGPPFGGIKGNIYALSEIFNTKKPCSIEFHRENVSFTCKTAN